jgi:hypothetical protein
MPDAPPPTMIHRSVRDIDVIRSIAQPGSTTLIVVVPDSAFCWLIAM